MKDNTSYAVLAVGGFLWIGDKTTLRGCNQTPKTGSKSVGCYIQTLRESIYDSLAGFYTIRRARNL